MENICRWRNGLRPPLAGHYEVLYQTYITANQERELVTAPSDSPKPGARNSHERLFTRKTIGGR